MRNIFLILGILFFPIVLTSQDLTPERLKMMAQMYHMQGDRVFNKKSNKEAVTIDYNESYYFEIPFSDDEINNQLKQINSNATIQLDSSIIRNPSILLECPLISDGKYPYESKFTLEVKKVNLKLNSEDLELRSIINNGSSEKEIKYAVMIGNEDIESKVITGSVTYEIGFLSGHDQVELTKKDIGKTFTINNTEYKLIDIFDNKVILHCLSEERVKNIDVINFVSASRSVQTKFFETEKEHFSKKSLPMYAMNHTSEMTGLYASVYQTFKENLNITKEDFEKLVTVEFMEKTKSSYYNIYNNVAPIGEKIIIYCPVYEKKEFTVNY